MYIIIYIHTYIYIYIYTHIHTYIHTYMLAHAKHDSLPYASVLTLILVKSAPPSSYLSNADGVPLFADKSTLPPILTH